MNVIRTPVPKQSGYLPLLYETLTNVQAVVLLQTVEGENKGKPEKQIFRKEFEFTDQNAMCHFVLVNLCTI